MEKNKLFWSIRSYWMHARSITLNFLEFLILGGFPRSRLIVRTDQLANCSCSIAVVNAAINFFQKINIKTQN